MRRYSLKRQRAQREHRKHRDAYRAEHQHCMVCSSIGTDVHEITSGSAGRVLGEGEPATWLLTCHRCNCFILTDKREWPVSRQLALKLIKDAERFDLEAFNKCYTLGSVHLMEVAKWLSMC